MTKLIRIEAENFKRLKAVEVRLADNGITVVAGRNGQGKSSLLDAIQAALGGGRAAPAEPLRRGEKKGHVVCEMDGLVVKRTFTPSGGTLTVTPSDGAPLKSPQAVLDRLYGSLSWDPLAFLRMAPRERLNAVLDLCGDDARAIEDRRNEIRERRSAAMKDGKAAGARAEKMPFFANAPAEPVSVTAMVAELRKIQDEEARIVQIGNECAAAIEEADRHREERQRLLAEIERLKGLVKAQEEMMAAAGARADALLSESEKADPEALAAKAMEIEGRIDGAQEINRQVDANVARQKAIDEAMALADVVAGIDAELKAVDEERRARLATALRSVPGMDIGPDGVMLNDLPFEQASTSEQIRAAMGIGIAANPELRLLLIREGSLLDNDTLEQVSAVATENDMQVFIERVGDLGGEVGVVIEDGSAVEEVSR